MNISIITNPNETKELYETKIYVYGVAVLCIDNSGAGCQPQLRAYRSMLDETGGKYLDKVEYFDGLGRPFQTVLKKVTASNSNLVTLQEYDVAGRAANSCYR